MTLIRCYAGESLLAVDVINDARTFAIVKRLLEEGISPRITEVESSDTNLKVLLKQYLSAVKK